MSNYYLIFVKVFSYEEKLGKNSMLCNAERFTFIKRMKLKHLTETYFQTKRIEKMYKTRNL